MSTPTEVHAKQVEQLQAHIAHFRSTGDELLAQQFEAQLKHTRDRLGFDKQAEAFVAQLGLTEKVTPATVTYSDAVNFVAKVLHEVAHGVKLSHYQRAHRGIDPALNGGAHVDAELLAKPWDPAADVAEHLGLTERAHLDAARALFQK